MDLLGIWGASVHLEIVCVRAKTGAHAGGGAIEATQTREMTVCVHFHAVER